MGGNQHNGSRSRAYLNGHTLIPGGSRPPTELEADSFSGFVLYKMGANLEEAQAAMNAIASEKGSETHPPKRSRLAAIESGWTKAKDQDKSNSTNPSTETKTTSNKVFQRSDLLGVWECLEQPENYVRGSGKIPSEAKVFWKARFSDNGKYEHLTEGQTLNWRYTEIGKRTGNYELVYSFGSIGARVRINWLNEDIFEDEILYSNEPSYIGIWRVWRRVK